MCLPYTRQPSCPNSVPIALKLCTLRPPLPCALPFQVTSAALFLLPLLTRSAWGCSFFFFQRKRKGGIGVGFVLQNKGKGCYGLFSPFSASQSHHHMTQESGKMNVLGSAPGSLTPAWDAAGNRSRQGRKKERKQEAPDPQCARKLPQSIPAMQYMLVIIIAQGL